jgi:hypothetical protein
MGRVVLAVGGKAASNGSDTCPAIITRVWQENDGVWLTNARLLPDASNESPAVTSVYLYDDEQTARDSRQHEAMVALYWPPRV